MNPKQLLIIAAAGVVTFLVIQAVRGKRYATSSGQNVVPGGQQDQYLTDQCGGWAECLNGWGQS